MYIYQNCSNLISITIPNTWTSIARSAFKGCSCLTSIAIPNSVTSIGDYAFEGCSGLINITIPNSVTSIGGSAFENCSGLTSITIPNTVTSIGWSAFTGCSALTNITIPNSVTSIGSSAFENCSGLTSVTIPNSVTSIEVYAFAGCIALEKLIIEDGNETLKIHSSSFLNCPLKSLFLRKNLSHSYGSPFKNNVTLKELSIGSSVTSIEKSAFSGTALENLIIEDGDKTLKLEYDIFSNCPLKSLYLGRTLSYTSSPFQKKSTLTEVSIGNSVTSIGNEAFKGCSGLTSITMPNSVTNIGMSAFSGCSELTSITIPNSVTSIGWSTFRGCSGLTSITIPNTVTDIGDNAFKDCTALENLILEDGDETLKVGDDIFSNCPLKSLDLGRTMSYGYATKQPFYKKTTLTEVTIGKSVRGIGTFEGCSALTSITIPGSVMRINTFKDCKALEKVILEDGDETLKMNDDVFLNCPLKSLYLGRNISGNPFSHKTMLAEVSIGSSVTSIGDKAFSGCAALEKLIIEDGDETLSLGNNDYYRKQGLFYDCPLKSLYLGRNLVNDDDYIPFNNKSTLTEVSIGNSVTSIGYMAFSGCSGLASVTIPNSVTSIEDNAFSRCSGLTSVIIPNSVTSIRDYAFEGCSSLTSVTIPNSVTSIRSSVFMGCLGLTSVTIPNSVTSIRDHAFEGCLGLTSVTIPNSVTSIGNSAFMGCSGLTSITIPNSVTSIEGSTFSNCTSLEKFIIEDENKILELGDDNFSDCPLKCLYLGRNLSYNRSSFHNLSKLTEVSIGNSVTSIGKSAFENCTSLEKLIIEDGDETLELKYDVFSNCPLKYLFLGRNLSYDGDSPFINISTLKEVNIDNSVTSIGDNTFNECTALEKLVIEDGAETLKLGINNKDWNRRKGLFDNCPLKYLYLGRNISESFCNSAFNNSFVSNLTEVNIGNHVTSIEDYTFTRCRNLKSLIIGNSVTNIGEWAFSGCSGLISVTIPNSVTSIGEYAFSGCSGLTSITMSNSVTNIEDGAFSGCLGLTSITIPNSVKSIGSNAFKGCTTLEKLIIEDGTETLKLGYNYIDYYTNKGLFSDCPLNYLYLGRNLSDYLFNNKPTLTEVNIGNSITNIGNNAFTGCNNIVSIYSLNSVPPNITDDNFNSLNYMNATLYVPNEAVEEYKTTYPWSKFRNIQIHNLTGIQGVEVYENHRQDIYYDINGRRLSAPKKGLNIINGKKVIIK